MNKLSQPLNVNYHPIQTSAHAVLISPITDSILAMVLCPGGSLAGCIESTTALADEAIGLKSESLILGVYLINNF